MNNRFHAADGRSTNDCLSSAEALSESSAYLQFFRQHPLPMFITDAETLQLLDLNGSAVLHYGYSKTEAVQMNLSDLSLKNGLPALRLKLEGRAAFSTESVHRKKSGECIDVEVVAHKILYAGRFVWMSTVNDVSERKKAEKELAASERKYRLFVEQSVAGIWRFNMRQPLPLHYAQERIIDHFYENCYLAECNDAMAQMYGLERKEEFIGKGCEFFLPRADESSRAFFEEFINSGFKAKNYISYKCDVHGSPKVFLNNFAPYIEDGHLLYNWGTQLDITQQRADEESIEYLAAIVENAADAIYTLSADRRVIGWNKACEKLFGVSATEIKDRRLREFFVFRSLSAPLRVIGRTVATQGTWKGEALVQHKKTGEVISVLAYVTAQKDAGGNVNRLLVFCRDISEQRKTEHLLKESEDRFVNMADAAPAMIYMMDEKDRPFYFNREWLRFTGRTMAGEIAADPVPDIHPRDVEAVKRTYYSNTLARRPFELEYRRRNHQGEYRWITDRCTPRFLEDGTYIGYLGFSFDIHERKKAEEEAQRQAVAVSGILNSITDGFVAISNDFTVMMWNREAERIFNLPAQSIIGKPAHLNFKAYKNTRSAAVLNEALLTKTPAQFEEYIAETGLWAEASLYPYRDGFFIYFKDTTGRRRKQMLLGLQKSLLEADSLGRNTVEELATKLTTGVEAIFPGTLCFLCRTNETTGHFQTVLTPSIPEALRKESGKLRVAEFCKGREGFTQPLVIEDLQCDARWEVYHDLLRQHGLRSATVVPVLSSSGATSAILSLYYFERRCATAEELEILQQLASLLATITEKRFAEEKQEQLERQLSEEKLQQQRRISEALLEGSERERSEISMELHDNVNQVLSSAKLYMEMGMAEDGIKSEFGKTGIQYVMDAINEIRRLSHRLASPAAKELTLADAVEGYVHNLQQTTSFGVRLGLPPNEVLAQLSEGAQLSLYRIVQEHTHNIVKYAQAKNVAIRLAKEGAAFVLTIEDDGIGFDPAKVDKGLGLCNIASRAALFNGSAVFDTAPGKGCKLEVTIPVGSAFCEREMPPANRRRA